MCWIALDWKNRVGHQGSFEYGRKTKCSFYTDWKFNDTSFHFFIWKLNNSLIIAFLSTDCTFALLFNLSSSAVLHLLFLLKFPLFDQVSHHNVFISLFIRYYKDLSQRKTISTCFRSGALVHKNRIVGKNLLVNFAKNLWGSTFYWRGRVFMNYYLFLHDCKSLPSYLLSLSWMNLIFEIQSVLVDNDTINHFDDYMDSLFCFFWHSWAPCSAFFPQNL